MRKYFFAAIFFIYLTSFIPYFSKKTTKFYFQYLFTYKILLK